MSFKATSDVSVDAPERGYEDKYMLSYRLWDYAAHVHALCVRLTELSSGNVDADISPVLKHVMGQGLAHPKHCRASKRLVSGAEACLDQSLRPSYRLRRRISQRYQSVLVTLLMGDLGTSDMGKTAAFAHEMHGSRKSP
mgnify:CR=1 FL=1